MGNRKPSISFILILNVPTCKKFNMNLIIYFSKPRLISLKIRPHLFKSFRDIKINTIRDAFKSDLDGFNFYSVLIINNNILIINRNVIINNILKPQTDN